MICLDLVQKPDPAPFLTHIEDHAASFFGDHLIAALELLTAIATQGMQRIAGEAFGVNAHKHGLFAADIAQGERNVIFRGDVALEGDDVKITVWRGQFSA